MGIKLTKFVRKPFAIEAVEVTQDNMAQVSAWCKGRIRVEGGRGPNRRRYIQVDVKRPLDERQTRAYVGDFVVVASDPNITGFKVYTPTAFSTTYEKIAKDMQTTLERMSRRVEEETRYEETVGPVEELRLAHKNQA